MMNETKRIRVVVVDDHAVVRSGLSAFLLAFDDLELVGEADSGEEAVRLCSRVMPGMDGVGATKAVREECPETQVIALTSFGDQERVQAVLKAGAIAYLLKNVSAQELVAAVRNAAVGKPTLAAEAARALIQATTGPKAPGFDLTDRERAVLTLMVRGMGNSQIADHLVISPSTTKFHVSNILSKLGVSTRTEAVAVALQNHLVEGS
jgi:NarL family two-component system response regulator LiaR